MIKSHLTAIKKKGYIIVPTNLPSLCGYHHPIIPNPNVVVPGYPFLPLGIPQHRCGRCGACSTCSGPRSRRGGRGIVALVVRVGF